jgi:choline dehydrogenase-like flavoprotein
MTPFDADVIVIGSGPAGVSASFPLIEAGRRVLMIDGAGAARNAAASPWDRALGAGLEALKPDDGLSPKLRTPLARAVVEPFRRDCEFAEDNFYAIGARARGGLSRIWGGFVAEFDDADMQDWPFKADALRDSYRAVTSRIGVSGSCDDDMASFFGQSGPLLTAPQIGPNAKILLDSFHKAPPDSGFSIGLARNALLTADRGARQACDLSQSCLWGCERGAIYDSSYDLATLRGSPHFELRDGLTAIQLRPVENGWEVALRENGQPLRAPRVIVAAGAFGTLKLVLPILAASETGELPFLNSPVLATPLLLPKRLGATPPRQGYNLAQLGYRFGFGDKAGDYVTGGIYEVSELPPSSFAARLPFGRRAGTEIFRALAPALLVATTYFPGNCSANRATWRRTGDELSIKLHGGVTPELDRIAPAARRKLTLAWRSLGAYALPGASFATPGMDAHLGGLFPMGSDGRYGSDQFGQPHAAPGLYLVDGAVLPSVPSKPTTLTIMANADRIGRHLAATP